MSTAAALVSLLAIIALPASLIMMLFKRFRRRAKWSALAALVLLISCVIMVSRGADETAREAGFVDDADKRKAETEGFKDATTWHQKLALDREQAAKVTQAKEAEQRKAQEVRNALIKPPPEQATFVRIIEDARTTYKNGSTDLQKGAARPARSRQLCANVPSRLTQWIGKVSQLSTNGDGDGVLAIEIANDVMLKTWNNSVSDIGTGSLIKAGTPLYNKLLTMKVGQLVRFNADLFSGGADCYREMSATMSGAIQQPEFVTSFTRVDRVDPNT